MHIVDRRYRLCTSKDTQVRIYSNADAVELSVNGSSHRKQNGATGVFRWDDVPLVKENNVVLSTSSIGATVHEDRVVWVVVVYEREPDLAPRGAEGEDQVLDALVGVARATDTQQLVGPLFDRFVRREEVGVEPVVDVADALWAYAEIVHDVFGAPLR